MSEIIETPKIKGPYRTPITITINDAGVMHAGLKGGLVIRASIAGHRIQTILNAHDHAFKDDEVLALKLGRMIVNLLESFKNEKPDEEPHEDTD